MRIFLTRLERAENLKNHLGYLLYEKNKRLAELNAEIDSIKGKLHITNKEIARLKKNGKPTEE